MATILGSMSVGSIVKIKENGTAVNYIIVHKGRPSLMYDSSCDGVWVLREQAHSNQVFEATSGDNNYENSDIHAWLNVAFLNTIDSKIREMIKTVKIPVRNGTQAIDVVSCKSFLLSGFEVGYTRDDNLATDDSAKLSYFSNNVSRICWNSDCDGDGDKWWLRAQVGTNDFRRGYVGSWGAIDSENINATTIAARPAFILPASTVVNIEPTISSDTASGSNLGEKSAPFNFTYTVNDADNDTVTVKEYLDNVLQRSYTATLGATNTFQAASDPALFQKILNGTHTIKVIATDSAGNSSTAYMVTFNKQVKTATITLTEPLPADDVIKAAVVTVTGNIPNDATLQVLVTNNARDTSPVWEDMSQDVKQGVNHVFANKTAAKGFAFNFKVTVTRGASGTQGYISSIGGAFE